MNNYKLCHVCWLYLKGYFPPREKRDETLALGALINFRVNTFISSTNFK